MSIPPSGARGIERFPSLKNNNAQKREIRLSLGLDAAKNTPYMGKCFKLKLFNIEFRTKKSVGVHAYLLPEWSLGALKVVKF